MARKTASFDEDALYNAIEAARAASYGADGDDTLAAERATAIRRYIGQNTIDAPEGTSRALSRDTYDTIGWILPSLIRIFTNSDQVCVFDPVGPEDEDQADQESLAVSHVVQRQNNWFQVCHDWFLDALLLKNAYAMAYWDRSVQVETETYESLTEQSLAMLLDDGDAEVVEHAERPDPDAQPQPMLDPMGQPMIGPDGMPMMQPPPMLHDVVIKRTAEAKRVKLCVLPPERVVVSHYTPDFTLRRCPYFEYWEMRTLSDLRADGLKVEDDITDGAGDEDTVEDEARNQYGESITESNIEQTDPSLRRVRARVCFIRFDADGDGIAELQQVILVGRTILHREVVNRIPVACITPVPLSHRHMGMSIADAVADIEAIKTAILRQGLNNLYQANNPRLVVNDKVNLDDLLYAKPNGIVRTLDGALPGEVAMPLPVPNIFTNAMQALEMFDGVRENRTGTNRYFTGTDANSLNQTATGVAQLTSSSQQRVEHIARICAMGVEELFSIVHEMMLKHGQQKHTMRLAGKWVDVDPSQWKNRDDLRINVGLGTGNREQVLMHLNNILGAQEKFMALGLATPDNIHHTLQEMTKAAGFSGGERFWNDPQQNPIPAPPNPDAMKAENERLRLEHDRERDQAQNRYEVAAKALEATMKAVDVELKRYEIDQGTAIEVLKLKAGAEQAQQQAEREDARTGQQIDAEDRRLHAQLIAKKDEAAQPGAKAGKSLAKGDALNDVLGAAANEVVEGLKAEQGSQIESLMSTMHEQIAALTKLAEGLTAEREIVRGPDGRPAGVRLKPAGPQAGPPMPAGGAMPPGPPRGPQDPFSPLGGPPMNPGV